ncbi:hypothetical protein [Tolypothrix sp. VBCCA 56010]|uniref:hypothetical protein n=1 Tax=Tolypothrix sp. VBCCA 56010 TaxID=3137731 RepID=UPI003D7ED69C
MNQIGVCGFIPHNLTFYPLSCFGEGDFIEEDKEMGRQGDKGTGGQGDNSFSPSPCLLISLSPHPPCPLVSFFNLRSY